MKKLKDRIKNNFNNNKKIIIVFLCVWLVAIIGTPIFYKDSLGNEPVGNEVHDKVIRLEEGITLQQIIPIEENAKSISIMFATYARKNSGDVYIKVIGEDSEIVYAEKTINAFFMQDNASVNVGLNQQLNLENDERIIIELSSNSKTNKAVGVYISNEPYFDNSELREYGFHIDGQLTVKYLIENKDLKTICTAIIICSSIVLTLLLLMLLLIKPRYEILFTTIVMIFGLIFMIVITPMSPPDEQLHYENCLQLANYVFGDGDSHVFVNQEYAKDAYFGGHYNTCMAYIRLMKEFNEPLELSGEYKECLTDVEGSYVIYYIPQVLGIVLSRLLNLNMLKMFYTGRLFNLIFYAICIYISIKNTPTHKVLFGIIGSLPIFIQQVSSYSYDSFVIGLCFIEISFFFKWLQTDEQIKKKDFILTFLVCLGLAPAKIVYGLLSLMFVFVPVNRFGNKKKKIICTLLLCSPALIMIFYNIFLRIGEKIIELFTIHADTFIDGERLWTVNYCLEQPVETIKLILRTVRYGIKKWFYDAITFTLSGQTLSLPLIFTYLYIAIVFISSFIKEERMPTFAIITSVSICISVGLLTMIGMLTGWTKRSAIVIDGVQGRYFCPILPYFFSIFSNKKFGFSNKLNKYVIFTHILVFYEVVMYVLSYTFVN